MTRRLTDEWRTTKDTKYTKEKKIADPLVEQACMIESIATRILLFSRNSSFVWFVSFVVSSFRWNRPNAPARVPSVIHPC